MTDNRIKLAKKGIKFTGSGMTGELKVCNWV